MAKFEFSDGNVIEVTGETGDDTNSLTVNSYDGAVSSVSSLLVTDAQLQTLAKGLIAYLRTKH